MDDLKPVDLVVLGSGVGGLTAALSATLAGLSAVVLERAPAIGGTSARSSGTVWVPGNHYLDPDERCRDRSQAEDYLSSLIAGQGERAVWRAFLENAPRMLENLDRQAGIGFRPYGHAPDYRQDHPGAATGRRALEPLPFDGRRLGAEFSRIAWPLPELMAFGGMMLTRAEAQKLLRADRSLAGAWLAFRLGARYAGDRLTYRRGTRLVLGNALVARLFKALSERGVPVLTKAMGERLIEDHGRIAGVALRRGDDRMRVTARRGVVLAGGGFPASATWRRRELPEPVAAFTPAASECDGSTLELALSTGAALGPAGLDNALWFPSSTMTRADGSTAVYPHIVLDRAKPGLIAVNAAGRRFANEALSYHEFVRAMYRAHRRTPSIPAWLICDRRFIRRYGLGLIRPRAFNLRKYLANGYLHEAPTLGKLAEAVGVEATGLEATVARVNAFAETGVDRDFDKGGNIYDRSNGDPNNRPNPCLGRIATPPYYAVAVVPTPLGTSRGLAADPSARVRDAAGDPIPGLYVCGNDMQSAFGGEYPGAGAQLGQAMTFGWIAARHAAGVNVGAPGG